MDDRDGFGGVLGYKLEHLFSHLCIRLLYQLHPYFVELPRIDPIDSFLFIAHLLNLLNFLLQHSHRLLEVVDLEVYLVHVVLSAEENVLVLVAELELETLGTLGKTGYFIIEHTIQECLSLRVLSPLAQRLWELAVNLIVAVGYVLELGGIKLRQRLAQQVLVPPRNVPASHHVPQLQQQVLRGLVEEGDN